MLQNQQSKQQQLFAALIAIAAALSVILQYIFRTGSAANFFSFFTIQCNILVAITAASAAFFSTTRPGRFFTSTSVQTAIALYIFIVALVYNTVLRGLIPLEGWNLLLDTMLHVVNPLLYLSYWFMVSRKKSLLEYKHGLYWSIFPFAYLVYSMIRGAVVGWYPYPFLNAVQKGYPTVALNILIMIVVFLIAGLLLIAATRSLRKR
ncbi:MAG: hypothetical protein EOO13_18440 [Chitinophagaceae bacterium]|nr:MAG: hypothetical protein EOO13_18440 [Chitinophagaceae bacterium]